MSFCVFCAWAFLGLCSWAANLTPVVIRVWAFVSTGVSPQEQLAILGTDNDGAVDFCVLYVFDRGGRQGKHSILHVRSSLTALGKLNKCKLNTFFPPICLSRKGEMFILSAKS